MNLPGAIDVTRRRVMGWLAIRGAITFFVEPLRRGALVAAEFKIPLANVYGIAYYEAPEQENARKTFWARAFASPK